ncbi:hypothetical protein [Acinetobacter baumannii]|uniref:hypothetical protein n=1 Tax=Acinetobacter baumannii TaxID=470 RepID=UPI001FFF135D|nr:hypothetical protein [Acinetobacter baumannii]
MQVSSGIYRDGTQPSFFGKQIVMCFSCHHLFDTYQLGNRQESEELFNKWLKRTNAMLESDDDLF